MRIVKKLLCIVLLLIETCVLVAQNDNSDLYRWVEENGVYSLAGNPQKGETATIKIGSYYCTSTGGSFVNVWMNVLGYNETCDYISVFYSLEGDGLQNNTEHPARLKEGWNDVYLTARHEGDGEVSDVRISDIILPVNYTYPIADICNIYDINGDGNMEFLKSAHKNYDYSAFYSYQYPGFVSGNHPQIPEGKRALLCNLNNDGIPDIRYLYGGNVAISQQGQKWQIVNNVTEAPYLCDYNNDGRIDLMKDSRSIYHQGADGKFSFTEIIPITSEEDTLKYNRWEAAHKNQGIGLGNLGGDVGVPVGGSFDNKLATFSNNREFYSMDFNKDGHEDLIDEVAGTIMINRGDNRFLIEPQSGRLYMRDLNGDLITDYISYDEDTRTVESVVFQKDGKLKRQVLMSNLSMDKRIYFNDFNNDGFVDVLLPFSCSESTGNYSYLVLAINDGTGSFTINENNTYHRSLFFVGCADVNNDGFYDVLALEKNQIRRGSTIGSNECDLFWLKGNDNLVFEEVADVLIPTQIECNYYGISGDAESFIGDFDNDGVCDVLVHSILRNRDGSEPRPTVSFLYSFKNESSVINLPPQKLQKPNIVSDETSGMLQVNWQMGEDDLTPQCDLSYALRIGTEPNKGDIFYAAADENGRRLNIMLGNMEYNTSKILNVSGWKNGKYYISVQAIDAMGKGSAWSDPIIYQHKMLTAPIYIPCKDVSTADTITMAFDGVADSLCTYNWKLDGGNIVSSSKNGSIVHVIYDTPGQKYIALTVTDKNGNSGISQATDLYVRAVRFDEIKMTDRTGNISFVSDIDNDGSLELLTEYGFYQQTNNNEFEKVPGIYNTDLRIDPVFAWDYNRDGLVDFIGGINYEYTEDAYMSNLLLNQGNKRFTRSKTVSEVFEPKRYYTGQYRSYGYSPIYDFNNDGLPDYYKRNYEGEGNDTIYENTGDWKTFIAHPIHMNKEEFRDYSFQYVDINGDNLIDIFALSRQSYHYLGPNKVVFFINEGNFSFKRVDTNICVYCNLENFPTSIKFIGLCDLNNDGIKDVLAPVEFVYENTYYNVYLSHDGEIAYNDEGILVEGPEMGGEPDNIFYDIDNNGFIDFISRNLDRVLYNYGDGHFELITAKSGGDEYLLFGNAVNGDLVFLDKNGIYKAVANSRITNTSPAAPTGIRAVQDTDGYLNIYWNSAEDAETPPVLMQYNLSVKKHGAVGEGAFVISPLNNIINESALIPNSKYYLRNTQIRIPISAFSVGEYEISLQSIDGQFAVSAFSEPIIVKILSTPLLDLPTSICCDKVATIRYTGTGGRKIDIDFGVDAQILTYDNDRTYEVVWSSEGYKTITVTSDGITHQMQAYVNAPFDASFTLPETTLCNTNTYFEISNDIFRENRNITFTVKKQGVDNFFVNPAIYSIKFERKSNTKEVRAFFEEPGIYIVRMSVSENGCGEVFNERKIEVLESIRVPEISLVTVDKETGKNRINWNFTNLPNYITSVGVYREGAHYNKFELLEEVDPALEGYTDLTSNPIITATRYRICFNTEFGVSTESSEPHQSVHLTINQGMNGSWNLIWNAYIGRDINAYHILRGTTLDNMEEIASVPGSTLSYTDINAPEGFLYYAIAYDAYYKDEWQPMSREVSLISAQSNIVSVAKAKNLQFAEEIYIRHLEKEAELNENQTKLHLYAEVYPISASCKNVNWTIVEGEDLAYITPQGLLVSLNNNEGKIIVRATTIDGSNVINELTVVKKGYYVRPTSLLITSQDDMKELSPERSSLQLYASVLPSDAPQSVVWSIVSGSDLATLSETGLLSSVGSQNGTVIVRATSAYDSSVYGDYTVTKSGFYVNPTSVSVTSEEGINELLPEHSSLQLYASVLPSDAPQSVIWSVVSGSDLATLSETGLLSSVGSQNGTVIVRATSAYDSSVYGDYTVTKSGFYVNPTSVSVTSEEGINELLPEHSSLQLYASVLPSDAPQSVVWSVVSGSDLATLSETGLLSSVGSQNGTVIVRATSVYDGSVYGDYMVTKSGFFVNPTSVSVTSEEGINELLPEHSSLQLYASVLPSNAPQSVVWSIVSGSDLATLSETGLLSSIGSQNGTVIVRATSAYDGSVYGDYTVTKSGFFVNPTSVSVTSEEGINELLPEHSSLQLYASVLPSDAPQSVVWSIVSGSDLATLSETGLLSSVGSQNGTVIVRATSVYDGSVCGDYVVNKLGFVDVSVNEIYLDNIKVWINSDLYISGLPRNKNVQCRIIDMTGQMLIEESVFNKTIIKLNVSNIVKGIYTLQILIDGKIKNIKFIR